MSQPSRAQRRQASRGDSTRPPHRDPMISIYIGIAVVLVIVFTAFAIAKWHGGQVWAAANATPTPGPNANAKAIQLSDTTTSRLGQISMPLEFLASTDSDKPIDGIDCQAMEGVALHIHSHLALFVNGKQLAVPAGIGMALGPDHRSIECLHWIHTHNASGIIHIETPDVEAPSGGPYTLGMLFDVWGVPLTRTAIGPFKGPVIAYVNGSKYDGDLNAIPLAAHQQITLEVGTPTVPPPNYKFPEGD
jgi:hypothetical protein